MKKTGVLNNDISQIIAQMGHMDHLTICDAGLPIPKHVKRIDLAIKPGLPAFLDVVNAVAEDLEVEKIILALELKENNPVMVESLSQIFNHAEIVLVPHDQFKDMSADSRAIIRTGECTPYANVILVSGVIF